MKDKTKQNKKGTQETAKFESAIVQRGLLMFELLLRIPVLRTQLFFHATSCIKACAK